MMSSYDIQGAGHIDTLKLICKTSLKANQLIDMGDIEGFQKMSKVYDSLMKSGKFTAAQNKAESGEFVDSVGELIEICEKHGYIERFYIEQPNDKVDLTI
jgi:polyhydroxyalkanoate synthesis regulator phasin